MGNEVNQLSTEIVSFRELLLNSSALDVLLYLAKYNPNVDMNDMKSKFGNDVDKIVNELKKLEIVEVSETGVTLTRYGIFQVAGLVEIVH